MGMILDVTAGNRVMWSKNKTPLGVIFIDRESGLAISPDILADNTYLPIRTDLDIDSIIFDPPWLTKTSIPPWMLSKKERNQFHGGFSFYDYFNSKKEIVPYIYKAQREFKKYTNILCMKWGDRIIPLDRLLGMFARDGWVVIHRNEIKNYRIKRKKDRTRNWWVTFIRKRERK